MEREAGGEGEGVGSAGKRGGSGTLEKIKTGECRKSKWGDIYCFGQGVVREGLVSCRVGASGGHVPRPHMGSSEWLLRKPVWLKQRVGK